MFKKELSAYFSSATAAVSIGIFLCFAAMFLFVLPSQYNVLDAGYASLDPLFELAPWLYLFLIPAITMRSFAEEFRLGTFDLLLSKPVSPIKLLLSKYFAALVLVVLALLPTLFYLLPVCLLGSPQGNMDFGAFWGSFIGLILLAAAYVSIGIFTSTLGENQVVAFILAALLCFLAFYGFEFVAGMVDNPTVADLLSKFSLSYHYDAVSRGVIDSFDLVYFLSISVLFLFLAYLSLYKKGVKPFAISLVLLVAVNIFSANFFFRLDLTSEKRYSLSQQTKTMLRNTDGTIKADIYLSGDLNVGFLRLQKAVTDMLREMDAYSRKGVSVTYINPSEAANQEARNARYAELQQKGLQPSMVYERDASGNMQQKIVFPWAALSINADTVYVNLLQNIEGHSGAENLNISIESLEYSLTDAIRILSNKNPERVAFIEGHGEWDEAHVYSITEALSKYYYVDRGAISGNVAELLPYKVLIIAGPIEPFTETEKYALDQYIMSGGRVLFLIDGVLTNETTAFAADLNLSDQLFTYGVRINPLLLLDTDCAIVPINMAPQGQNSQFEPASWYYAPLLKGNEQSVICKNLSRIKADFCSPIDFVGNDSIKRTVLLTTAGNTGFERAPAPIRSDIFALSPSSDFFAYRNAPVAVMLEGSFRSVFANRLAPEGCSSPFDKKNKTDDTSKIIVVADGDIISNALTNQNGEYQALPLGYDRYMNTTFSNKDFLLNAVNYLADDEGWMSLRGRELKLRLLDKEKLYAQKTTWQVLCVIIPLVIFLSICGNYYLIRRKSFRN